jgi:hypothetical protein
MKGERSVDSEVEGLAWHLVNASFVPRVALEDAPQGEEGAVCCAMFLERLKGVGGATWVEPATAPTPCGDHGQRMEHWGNEPSVEMDGDSK